MAAKLYVVHGSHPCAAVKRALELKGVDYRIVEYPPPFHMAIQRLRTGTRTVPSIRFDSGEVVSGSSAIMHRLDELAAEPVLFPDARVEEAERWGDEVFQPIARTLLWSAFSRAPKTMVGYQEGGKLPPVPRPLLLALAPLVTRVERKANGVDDERLRSELAALPGHLDRIDGLIADGVIGGTVPNAADLQLASTVRLMMTVGDVRPLVASRPAGELALRLWPDHPGDVPAGTFPAEWVPASSSSSAASLAG
jgi:glutathione S-transferase